VSQIIQSEHQGKIVYGDSVTGDMPILVRDPQTREIMVRSISSLVPESAWMPYPNFRMFDTWHLHLDKQYALCPFDVWSDQGWTPIRKVIRHKTQKRLFTVGSARGVVCVTEDHSLLTASLKKIRPVDVAIGTKLLYSFPRVWKSETDPTPSTERVDKADLDIAYRRGVFCFPRVPQDLFSASVDVIRQFIAGFKREQFYPRLVFSDAALAQDFYVLLTRIGQKVQILTKFDNGNVSYELLEKSHLLDRDHTTVWFEHPRPTTLKTFVYDLETECGRFQAGVGEMIVKNTDSNYVMFPHLTSLHDIWSHSMHVSDAVSKHFPEPMRLEFEEHIYARYLILSKKRYLYFSCSPDGTISSKIEHKGVLLKRRDNSTVVRDIYEELVRMVLERRPETEVVSRLLNDIALMNLRIPQAEDYRISKSVKGISGFVVAYRDAKTIKYGDYVVPRLVDTERQLAEKGVTTEDAFYQSHLPGAVQLALRMRSRGQHIESGSRLSYVITRRAGHKESVSERMEEIEYFKLNYSKQMLDTLHYLHLLINPVEEVLTIIYGKKKYTHFVKDMYKYHIKYQAVVDQIYKFFHPIQIN